MLVCLFVLIMYFYFFCGGDININATMWNKQTTTKSTISWIKCHVSNSSKTPKNASLMFISEKLLPVLLAEPIRK